MSGCEHLLASNHTRPRHTETHYPSRMMAIFTWALLATLGLAGWGGSANSSLARPLRFQHRFLDHQRWYHVDLQ